MEELALSRGILRLLFRADEEQRIKQKARQGKNPSLCGPSIPKQRRMRVCVHIHAHTHDKGWGNSGRSGSSLQPEKSQWGPHGQRGGALKTFDAKSA